MRLKKTLKGNAYVFTGHPEIDSENQQLADKGKGILHQHNCPNFKLAKKEYLYQKTAIHLQRQRRIRRIAIGLAIGLIIGIFIRIQIEKSNQPLLSPLSEKRFSQNTDVVTLTGLEPLNIDINRQIIELPQESGSSATLTTKY